MSSRYFTFPYTIGFHDSDAAGIVFFASLVRVFHQATEAWMESIGFSLARLLRERPFGLPVVHIEGDFRKLLRVGDKVEIHVRVAEIGRTSFRTAYELYFNGELAATGALVQACVDVTVYKPLDLPEEFRRKLEEFA
jgi:YbgC/YbaW family acyl-CoA thioester hydrolase